MNADTMPDDVDEALKRLSLHLDAHDADPARVPEDPPTYRAAMERDREKVSQWLSAQPYPDGPSTAISLAMVIGQHLGEVDTRLATARAEDSFQNWLIP